MRLLVIAVGLAIVPVVSAQQAPAVDSAGIHPTLRAFYFKLAHHNWEAIAADVLSAKVVAHRAPPQFEPVPVAACPSGAGALVDAAVIRRDGDWAEVSVPRCDGGSPGADQFRLTHFEERWRFVYIELDQNGGRDLLAGDEALEARIVPERRPAGVYPQEVP